MIKVALLLALVAVSTALPRRLLGKPHRIVGGENAIPNEFPFMLSLQYFGSPICGGTIIRSNAVLTSAVCAEVGPASSLTVKAGKHNIHEQEATEQTREIESIHVHPGYPGDRSGFSNDIAVLKTKTPFVFNAAVAPVPIAPANHTATGTVTILGWGSDAEENGHFPDILQKAEVQVVSDEQCRGQYGGNTIEDNMICAGRPGMDSCSGDSGGPLSATDRGFRYLAGLTSFGFGCARPGYPGVYTEVSHHTDFINDNASN